MIRPVVLVLKSDVVTIINIKYKVLNTKFFYSLLIIPRIPLIQQYKVKIDNI